MWSCPTSTATICIWKPGERFPDTPVVLMTAYFFDKDHVIKRSKLEGLQEVIFKKPVDPDKLKDIILQRCRPKQAIPKSP